MNLEPVYSAIQKLNRSKYFLGFLIIFLNLSSKFIKIHLNKYHEKIMRDTIGRELMIFAICFVGTRDILAAFVMSSIFIVFNDYLFNEKSSLCVIPEKHQDMMRAAIDTNKDDRIDNDEIERAIDILNRANKQRQRENRRNAYLTFMNNL